MGGRHGGISPVLRNFKVDLDYAHSQADHPMWLEVYRQAFPSLASTVCVRNDGWAQRGGIDRVLVLGSGKTLYVDEKIRREAYSDVCLEYKHEYESGRKERGWIAKDLACDFIAYGWEPLGYAYIFPFHQLRAAWRSNRYEWVRKARARQDEFFESRSPNQGYYSVGCCTPIHILLDAITDAMRVDFRGMES